MSEIDKILEALKRSFLYQINCELTEKQSKTLLEHIDDLHFAVNENPELTARIAELEAENTDLRDCIEIMEDACDILRKENFRLFQQIFADEKLKQEEEHR